MTDKALVMGASGFLGSHVCKQLVAQGREVRIMLRPSSDTRALEGLPLETSYGDVHDPAALTAAMTGCNSVFYCVVDTRAWLRDPAPLYRTNVEGLRNALEVARHQPLKRFVFTSSFTTIGRAPQGLANESHPFNDAVAPPYMQCRAEAERLLFDYCERYGLPAIACCVGNTYGPGDFAPTPHGKPLADAARGRIPFYWEGGGPSVGIEDAARALLLAEQRGRNGERYIIAERFMDYRELFALAAEAGNRSGPKRELSRQAVFALSWLGDLIPRLRGVENPFNPLAMACSWRNYPLDNRKAREELGWEPRPVEESIRAAVAFYQAQYRLSRG